MDSSTHLATPLISDERHEAPEKLSRPIVPLEDLCCDAVEIERDLAAALYRQVGWLPHLNVVTWSSRNGLDRFRFARRVTRALGVPPSTLLRCYLAKAVKELRRSGHSYSRLSDLFGYADASSLHRALRRHSRSCPKIRAVAVE